MAEAESSKPSYLEPSPLGTKEYWDNLYTTEMGNHASDARDEGTVWFDDSAAEEKMVDFLKRRVLGADATQAASFPPLLRSAAGADAQNMAGGWNWKARCSFLDVGTGNGHLLFRLREGEGEKSDDDEDEEDEEETTKPINASRGWTGRMLGIDYSPQSIEFACRIEQTRSVGREQQQPAVPPIEFRCFDLMTQDPRGIVLDPPNQDGWDVVLDKGTFDAISLAEEKDARGRRLFEGYKERVVPLMRPGGILLLTSCNWTEDELKSWFQDELLEYVECIQYKSFSFGGKKGQTISSVCFRKKQLQS